MAETLEMLDPKNTNKNSSGKDDKATDSDEGYTILPSNGPGLAGDDGDQVVDGGDDDGIDDEEEDVIDDEEF